MGVSRKKYEKERLYQRKYSEKLDDIRSLLYGKNKSFRPYISTKNSDYSETETKNFINRLISILEDNYKNAWSSLSEDEMILYRSFLYCAIRIVDNGPFWDGKDVAIFENILEMSKSMMASGVEKDGFNDYFFTYMDEAYQTLTGISMLEKRREKYNWYDKMTDEEKESDYYNGTPGLEPVPTEKELENHKDDWYFYEEEQKEEERLRAEWKKDFKNPKEFCNQYEILIDSYYKAYNFVQFEKNIENMLNEFLIEEGLTIFSDEDDFLEVYMLFKSIEKKAKGRYKEGE